MVQAIAFKGHQDMPEQPITLGTTLVNKTGSWKYVRPIYHNKVAPCNTHCPTGNDIQAIMQLLAHHDWDAALNRILWENPFPSITGRVCHHPCESACNRSHFDAPLAIHHVERFLGDYGLRSKKPISVFVEKKDQSIAIVGAGPAGLAAAYHLARLGFEVVVFEAMSEPGGMLRYGIPENRLPKDILKQEIQKLYDLGIEILTDSPVGKIVSLDCLKNYDAVFLATGVGLSRKLNVPGEKLSGVFSGLEFLKKLNAGQSIQLGEKVVVIGGGNTAIDVARSVRRLGKQVCIFYRRTREEMPAIEDEIDEALVEGVELEFLVSPLEVLGQDGKVTGLEFIRMGLGEADASGRRRPIPIENSNFSIEVDTVMTAIGEAPDFGYLPEALRDNPVIMVDQVGRTEFNGVFAGGDIVDQPHTVVDALASGKRAAMAIDMFLAGHDLDDVLENIRVGRHGSLSMRHYIQHEMAENIDQRHEVEFDQINTDYFQTTTAMPMPHRDVEDLTQDFEEIAQGYTPDLAIAEAQRCFNCGICTLCDNCLVFCPDFAIQRDPIGNGYIVDYDYCKGCGICAYECPRNVIEMVREGSNVPDDALARST